jgi:hypothetical protein
VEDEITGQASQEWCIYAWGRLQVWTMTHDIPGRECKVKLQSFPEYAWLRSSLASTIILRLQSWTALRKCWFESTLYDDSGWLVIGWLPAPIAVPIVSLRRAM